MHITITRSGGFAGLTRRREIDTASLAPDVCAAVERLAGDAARHPAKRNRMPDAFEYEITIDGKTYVVSGDEPAWRALIERVGLQ